jgi:hypothetical protein
MNDFPTVRWLLRLLVNPGWAPLGVVAMHLALAHYGLTHRFDHLLHFLGGASIAYFLFGLLASLPSLFASIPSWAQYLLVFTTSCTVAVFWEFAEFASDRFLGTSVQQSVAETMLDLTFGVAGASTMLAVMAVFRGLSKSALGSSDQVRLSGDAR